MTLYLDELNDLVQAERIAAEARRQNTEAERRTLEPVERRLVRLLAAIPADEQAQGLAITQLQSQLKPRGRGHSCAHIGEIGAALTHVVAEARGADRSPGGRANNDSMQMFRVEDGRAA